MPMIATKTRGRDSVSPGPGRNHTNNCDALATTYLLHYQNSMQSEVYLEYRTNGLLSAGNCSALANC